MAGTGGVRVLRRRDGELLALFENPFRLERLAAAHPEWRLEPVLGDGATG